MMQMSHLTAFVVDQYVIFKYYYIVIIIFVNVHHYLVKPM